MERERGGRAGFSGDDPLHVLVFWWCAGEYVEYVPLPTAAAFFIIRICPFECKFVGGGEKS